MKTWRNPRPTTWLSVKDSLPEFESVAISVMGIGTGAMTGAVLGLVARGSSGALVGAVVGSVSAVVTLLLVLGPGSLRPGRASVGSYHAMFEGFDRELKTLKTRFAENPELVGRVGRSLLELRSGLVKVCKELTRGDAITRLGPEDYNTSNLRVVDEFDRARTLVGDTLGALDEELRISGRPDGPALLRDLERGDITELSAELKGRRAALAEMNALG